MLLEPEVGPEKLYEVNYCERVRVRRQTVKINEALSMIFIILKDGNFWL